METTRGSPEEEGDGEGSGSEGKERHEGEERWGGMGVGGGGCLPARGTARVCIERGNVPGVLLNAVRCS
jgi:hypothetical protein